MRLIDADAAIDALTEYGNGRAVYIGVEEAVRRIEQLPSAQSEPEAVFEWKKEFKEYIKSLDITRDEWKGIIEYINDVPTVQPERKTGRWLPDNTDYYRTRFICSVCGESEEVPTMGFGYAPMWGYCPNCGADNRGKTE
jgi:hypothetical protein